jgi:hypothetical protein
MYQLLASLYHLTRRKDTSKKNRDFLSLTSVHSRIGLKYVDGKKDIHASPLLASSSFAATR